MDGFVGNLMLKMAEGFGGFLQHQLANGLSGIPEVQTGLARIFEKLDYTARGGAPLLGVRGIVIKCHGRSNARAITNAIRVTADFIRERLNERIVDELKKMSWLRRISEWWTTKKEGSDWS